MADPVVAEAPVPAPVEEKSVKTPKPKKAKTPKEPKAKKASGPKKPKAPSAHPSYLEMITEAIVALKERTGSSHYAITKFIKEKHKARLPPNFKKLLLFQLKKVVASSKLTKIKSSFKLAPARTLKPVAKKPKPIAKPKSLKTTKPKPMKKASTESPAKKAGK